MVFKKLDPHYFAGYRIASLTASEDCDPGILVIKFAAFLEWRNIPIPKEAVNVYRSILSSKSDELPNERKLELALGALIKRLQAIEPEGYPLKILRLTSRKKTHFGFFSQDLINYEMRREERTVRIFR